MKARIILCIIMMSLFSFVYSQSQLIMGTVVPVSEKQGITFLPLAEKEPVSSLIPTTAKLKAGRNLTAPYPDISKINVYTTLSEHVPASLSPLMALDTVLMAKNANSVIIPVKTSLKGQIISGSILSGPGLSAVVQPLSFITDTVVAVNTGVPLAQAYYHSPEISTPAIGSPLDFLDTSGMKKKSFEESYSTPPPATSGLRSQIISKGTVLSAKGVSNIIEPVSSDSMTLQQKTYFNKAEPQVAVLTGDGVPGTTLPQSVVERPVASRTFYMPANPTPVVTPLDFLDTTSGIKKGDFVSTYTTPPVKTNLRSQNITGSIVAGPGQSSLIEPVSPDSLLVRQADNNKMQAGIVAADAGSIDNGVTTERTSISPQLSVPFSGETDLTISGGRYAYSPSETSIRKKNKNLGGESVTVVTEQSPLATNNRKNSTVIPDKTAGYTPQSVSNVASSLQSVPPDNDIKFNFFVNQYGKFAVRISSNYFYLNVTQSGKLTDYAILADGQVAGSNTRITQLGKTKITFDNRGWIETIAGEALAYTYDGRVNRVGNIYINYDNEGKVIKVGNIDINFNYNGTVEKFANYRVGYIKRRVIGIDDSNGLVIYRPEVEDNNNKPNF